MRWQLLDDLAVAREDWGLKDRTLSVLRALLSFLPKGERVNLTVFPSNRKLRERLMGMPESTLRRHLSQLVDAGLIQRRQSPNGKRYRIGTNDDLAFGLDLSPIFATARTIRDKAERALAEYHEQKRLRQLIRLHLVNAPEDVAANVNRVLRRKLTTEMLREVLADTQAIVPPEKDVSAAQNNCHIHTHTNPETRTDDTEIAMNALAEVERVAETPMNSPDDMKHVGERTAHLLAVHSAWTYARQARGVAWATMALAYLLPRADRLRHPDRYLHALTKRAGQGGFDLIAALRTDADRLAARGDAPFPRNCY